MFDYVFDGEVDGEVKTKNFVFYDNVTCQFDILCSAHFNLGILEHFDVEKYSASYSSLSCCDFEVVLFGDVRDLSCACAVCKIISCH